MRVRSSLSRSTWRPSGQWLVVVCCSRSGCQESQVSLCGDVYRKSVRVVKGLNYLPYSFSSAAILFAEFFSKRSPLKRTFDFSKTSCTGCIGVSHETPIMLGELLNREATSLAIEGCVKTELMTSFFFTCFLPPISLTRRRSSHFGGSLGPVCKDLLILQTPSVQSNPTRPVSLRDAGVLCSASGSSPQYLSWDAFIGTDYHQRGPYRVPSICPRSTTKNTFHAHLRS